MPAILEATCGFLHQLPDVDDKDPIEVPPGLVQALDNAAKEAKEELQGKRTATTAKSRADPYCY